MIQNHFFTFETTILDGENVPFAELREVRRVRRRGRRARREVQARRLPRAAGGRGLVQRQLRRPRHGAEMPMANG